MWPVEAIILAIHWAPYFNRIMSKISIISVYFFKLRLQEIVNHMYIGLFVGSNRSVICTLQELWSNEIIFLHCLRISFPHMHQFRLFTNISNVKWVLSLTMILREKPASYSNKQLTVVFPRLWFVGFNSWGN